MTAIMPIMQLRAHRIVVGWCSCFRLTESDSGPCRSRSGRLRVSLRTGETGPTSSPFWFDSSSSWSCTAGRPNRWQVKTPPGLRPCRWPRRISTSDAMSSPRSTTIKGRAPSPPNCSTSSRDSKRWWIEPGSSCLRQLRG